MKSVCKVGIISRMADKLELRELDDLALILIKKGLETKTFGNGQISTLTEGVVDGLLANALAKLLGLKVDYSIETQFFNMGRTRAAKVTAGVQVLKPDNFQGKIDIRYILANEKGSVDALVHKSTDVEASPSLAKIRVPLLLEIDTVKIIKDSLADPNRAFSTQVVEQMRLRGVAVTAVGLHISETVPGVDITVRGQRS